MLASRSNEYFDRAQLGIKTKALLPQSLISPPAPICAPMTQDRLPICPYCRKPMKFFGLTSMAMTAALGVSS
jgi:hypothetical protein